MLLTMKVVFELHEGIFKRDLDHLCLHSIQATSLRCSTACRISISLITHCVVLCAMYVVDKQLTLSGLQTSYHVCVCSAPKSKQ